MPRVSPMVSISNLDGTNTCRETAAASDDGSDTMTRVLVLRINRLPSTDRTLASKKTGANSGWEMQFIAATSVLRFLIGTGAAESSIDVSLAGIPASVVWIVSYDGTDLRATLNGAAAAAVNVALAFSADAAALLTLGIDSSLTAGEEAETSFEIAQYMSSDDTVLSDASKTTFTAALQSELEQGIPRTVFAGADHHWDGEDLELPDDSTFDWQDRVASAVLRCSNSYELRTPPARFA